MVVYQKRFFSLPPAVALDNSTNSGGSKTAGPFQTSDATSNDGGGDKSGDTCPPMVPKAVLLCRPNSHPFQDRYIPADQPIKVGRAVARCRQAINNAIFDCKVLSRNHASLWYENGKFYLQDTKSSNGTFVNNQRLSKGGEESPPREVSSGDIVQFGVDVLENSRKVTHGCIIATLKLYLPDGKEAKASPTISLASASHDVTISSQELYQLSQYLQEAMHREQSLENKLIALQRVVTSSHESTTSNWKAMVEEDHLLTKLQTLESQLLACSKNLNEEKLRQELQMLLEEKGGYQNKAKEELQKALEDKVEAQRKAQELELTLSRTEEESKRLWELYNNTDKELWMLWEEHNKTKKDLADVNKKLKEAEESLEVTSSRACEEKAALETSLEIMGKKVEQLSTQLESLQAECDFSKEQLAVMKGRLEELKDGPDEYVRISQGIQVEISLKENMDSNQKGILIESEDEISNLKAQLRMSKEEEEKSVNQTLALQAEINRLKTELDQVHLENEKNDFSTKTYSHHNGEVHSLDHLREEIDRLKELLDETKEQKHLAQEEVEKLLADRVLYIQKIEILKEDMEKMSQEVKEKSALVSSLTEQLNQVRLEAEQAQQEIKALKENLASEEQRRKMKTEEIDILKREISLAKQQTLEQKAEADNLKKKLHSLSSTEIIDHSQMKQLHQENATLRARIDALQAQIHRQSLENVQFMREKNDQAQKEIPPSQQPSTSEVDSRTESYVSSLEAELLSLRSQYMETCENNVTLQDQFARCNEERALLQKELDTLSEEFDILTIQTRMASACTVIPLIILLLAALFAFHPTISHFTATWDASPL